jgi:hypothetical protein
MRATNCKTCGVVIDNPYGCRKYCEECARISHNKSKKECRENKKLAGLCVDCKNKTEDGAVRCEACLKKSKDRDAALKLEVINKYGGCQCACLGCREIDIDCLQINHIDGNGNKHRKEINKKSGMDFYAWLKKNNFPPGYNVLCAICNFVRGLRTNRGTRRCCYHELMIAKAYEHLC